MTSSTNWSLTPQFVVQIVYLLVLSQLTYLVLQEAYKIRLYAIQEYGKVIHEFDPYFNYRATEYLYEHGWKSFKEWFDYMVWYPLGRPVGTTIYPGMQVTAVFIKNYILPSYSINDICVFMPAWFGVLATSATAFLCYECSVGNSSKMPSNAYGQQFSCILNDVPIVSIVYQKIILPFVNLFLDLLQKVTGSTWGLRQDEPVTSDMSTPALECAFFTAAIMSILPAHLMRSVGGGYDNESIAMFAMTFTFYCWTRSLRGPRDQPNLVWGCMTGLAYFYMVAAWGGYVFVLNLIGVHAAVLVLLGRYSTKLHRAYTAFYLVGTTLAIQVPIVGWTPLKSLEQLGPLAVFVGFQLMEGCEVQRRRKNLSKKEAWKLRISVFMAAALVAAIAVYLLAPTGYFGPISARVRGLFVKHTKTGNPLVDSVAEHQPANKDAYRQYLHDVCTIAPVGFVMVALFFFHDASSFLIVYGVAAYFFSHKMVRLILLTAPIGSVLGGLALGHLWGWFLGSIMEEKPSLISILQLDTEEDEDGGEKKKKGVKGQSKEEEDAKQGGRKGDPIVVRLIRFVVCVYLMWRFRSHFEEYYTASHEIAKHLSHPSIIKKGQLQNGQQIMIDDYREAYFWLRDNTPEDARIMAWWDYGYQITAMSNRTTIADGNTWNHEHIALLGKALTSPEKEGHRIARHLADYILVWAGGGGDDLAKSPHMRRIANSVYRDLCPGDPTCRSFGYTQHGTPTPSMGASLLYRLHSHKLVDGVEADKNRFRLVYTSTYAKVRIFKIQSVSKESKAWVAEPANRICDVEGGWFCRGQYPPALQKILKEKKDFKQLEDFNVEKEDDSEYQKKYFENLNDPEKARQDARQAEAKKEKRKFKKLSQEEIDHLNNMWEDNEMTTNMWQLVHNNDMDTLKEVLSEAPGLAHLRSSDGRGLMWWAHEYGRDRIIKMLKYLGVSETLKDAEGITPLDISIVKKE